jgi:hypothetical protein
LPKTTRHVTQSAHSCFYNRTLPRLLIQLANLNLLLVRSAMIERSLIAALRRLRLRLNLALIVKFTFRTVLILCALTFGASLYYRTTNLWALKNLGDRFISKGKRFKSFSLTLYT